MKQWKCVKILEKEIEQPQIENNSIVEKEEKKEDVYLQEDTYVPANSSISDIFSRNIEVEAKPKFNVISSSPKPAEQQTRPVITAPIQSKIIEQQDFIQEDVIIGQYKKTYILIEKENGLEIVDQHIAEERYIYEKLKESKNIDCQLLFISDVIEISATDKALLEANKEKLAKFGYELDFISETELIFRKIPQLLSKTSPKEILADILENIQGDIDNIEEQILITTSCKAAVKANKKLSDFEIKELLNKLAKLENSGTCPHGRPICVTITEHELERRFKRCL